MNTIKLNAAIDKYTRRLEVLKQTRSEDGDTYDDQETYYIDKRITETAEFIKTLKELQ